MNNLQLTKTGVDDYAVALGSDFPVEFQKLIDNAINPLLGILKTKKEINALLAYRKYPKLDTSKLPELCKEYLVWASRSTHSSDELLLLGFLQIAAACLRKSVQIKGPVNWMYLNIWGMHLGKSGSGKSTAIDIPISILRELDQPIFDKHKIDFDKYEEDLAEYEKLKKTKKKKNDEVSPKPKKPRYPPCLALSFPLVSSLERLTEIFNCDSSYGLINTSEEMASWLVNLLKTENLKEFCTGCYNGKVPPNFISYKSSRFVNVEEPILALCGPSTYEWVFDNLKTSDFRSGFLQRILFSVNDTHKTKQARPEPLDQAKRRHFKKKLNELYDYGLNHLSDSLKFELDEDAWLFFEKLFNNLEVRKENIQDDVIVSCLDRYWNDYLFKFALVLHAMEDGWQEKRFIPRKTIEQSALIIEYYEKVIIQILEELQSKDTYSMMRKLVDELRKSEELNIAYDDLANRFQGYSRHRSVFESAINKLEDLKIIERRMRKNNSRNDRKTCEIYLLQER